MMCCLPMLIFCSFLVNLNAEIFTSVHDLTRIFSLERNLVAALEDYVAKTEDGLHKIRRYLHDYKQVQSEIDREMKNGLTYDGLDELLTEKLVGNPIHTFRLLKRLSTDWQHIENYDPNLDWKGVEEAKLIAKEVNFSQFATEEDLQGAAQGIIRLQTVYKLNTTSLIRGNVGGIETSAELTAQDCLYIGRNSFNTALYYNALEWFKQAYLLAGLEKTSTITQEQAGSFLALASQMYEKTQRKQSGTKDVINTSSTKTKEKLNQISPDISDMEAIINYEALCRGEKLLSDVYIASLRCFYDHRDSSYLFLMPVKVEQFHHNPQVLLLHDVLRDKDINKLKEIALPKLSRSTVQGRGGKGISFTTSRTSRTAKLKKEEELKHFSKLNRYISHLTGLSSDITYNSSEGLQVANYGVGGHYFIHRDYLMVDKTEEELQKNFDQSQLRQGDRIATLMFYLSDVTRGGATAFPKLGVSLFPEKGAAVFWYNLKRSGEGDQLTLHGGCPVIHGVKWVLNEMLRKLLESDRNRWKSDGAKSSEYGGCGRISQLSHKYRDELWLHLHCSRLD